jgi:TonB family protein
MMPAIGQIMLAVSSSLAASIVAKVTVTTALALIGAWLARRSRAAVRHALLAAAFAVLLVLPAASIVAPPVRITLPAPPPERIVPVRPARAIPLAAPAGSRAVASVAPRSTGLAPSALLLTAWLAGTALFLLPVAIGLWQVRSLRRSALPWPRGQSVVDSLALAAGIRRRVEVLLHGALPGPITCGVVRPAIVLSPDAQSWAEEDLTRAIVHELEHVRRGDWLSLCLAQALGALYWFHPLVWMAWRRLALEAERSCDDAVLARSDAAAYADQLVGLAQRLSLAAKSPLLAMANRADLSTRVRAVLDCRQRRGRAGALPIALVSAAAAVLVIAASPLRMVAAPQAVTDAGVAMPHFSSTTELVIANVTVTDSSGRNIEGLNANDFFVTEDGVPQTIDIFEFQKVDAAQSGPRSYYTLGYYTPNPNADGRFRQIALTGKRDNMVKLRYRPGYYTRIVQPDVDRTTAIDGTSLVLLYKKEPEYSEPARKAKYQGTVILVVDVDASGTVTKSTPIRSLGLGLDEKAIEAVSQWKFRPAMKNGKTVPAQAQVALTFRLL